MTKITSLLLLLTSLVLITGCVKQNIPIGNPEIPYPPAKELTIGDIVHPATGSLVYLETVLTHAQSNRIIYLAETHDNPASHGLQQSIITGLADRGEDIAIGLEMLTPDQNLVLKAWQQGELTEKEFLKSSKWYDNWSLDFDYYREILLFARDNNIPIIGLNADKGLTRRARTEEIETLKADPTLSLPEINLTDPYQQAMATAIFGGHDIGGPAIDGFLRIQTIWDETMAESIVSYLEQPENSAKTLLVLAGGNHVRYGFGIPRRVFRRLPLPYLTIGGKEVLAAGEKEDRLMDVDMPTFPMPPYDFTFHIPYEDMEKRGVLLGVYLELTNDLVSIIKVMEGSVAESAGLQAEDIIKSVNSTPVYEILDLTWELRQTEPGSNVQLIIERGEEDIPFTITFPATEG